MGVGTASMRNHCRIIVLRYPESDALSCHDHPFPGLTR